jgi:hypothetical protein
MFMVKQKNAEILSTEKFPVFRGAPDTLYFCQRQEQRCHYIVSAHVKVAGKVAYNV